MDEREMVSADEARVFAQVAERTGHGDSLTARLARTVIAQAERIATLEAIVEGRTTPPTDAEIAAHDATGATWMIAHRDGQIVVTAMSWPSSRDWHVAKGAVRWWALTIDGRPCAWPEVSRG